MAVIERGRNAVRGVTSGLVLKAVQILCPFITRTAIIYALGMEYVGLNGLFTSVLQVLNLAELGVGSAMVFSMYKPIAEDDDEKICALMGLYRFYYRIIGAIVLVLGLALLPALPFLIEGDIPPDVNLTVLYLMNLTATVLSYWMFAYRNSLLSAYQRVDVASKITTATSLAQYAFQVLAVVVFRNYYLFVAVALLTQVLNNVVVAMATKRMYPALEPRGSIPKADRSSINRNIADLFTGRLGYVVTTAGNSLVASAFLGLSVLGVYQNYMLIFTSVAALFTILFNALLGGLGNAFATESRASNFKKFRAIFLLTFGCIAVASSCILCLTQPFMEMWVGRNAMLGDASVVMLALYFVAYETVMLLSLFKDAAGMWRPDRFRPAVSGFANIVLSIVLVHFWGVDGILVALVLSTWLISVTWILGNVSKFVLQTSFKRWVGLYGTCNALTVLGCICSFMTCNILSVNGIVGIIVKLLVTAVVSGTIFVIPFFRTPDFQAAIDMLNSAIGGKLKKSSVNKKC